MGAHRLPNGPVIVWFRQDLRIRDQAALAAAAESGRSVVPLYVLDDVTAGAWRVGGASRWWLHGSLAALSADLARLGAPLTLRRGPAHEVVAAVARGIDAAAVFCTRHVEPHWQAADLKLEGSLARQGVEFQRFAGTTLFEPGSITGAGGKPLRVFSPFWRACLAAPLPDRPVPAPRQLRPPARYPRGNALNEWGLLPTRPDWAGGLRETWRPGERDAQSRLYEFVEGDLRRYHRDRDRPEPAATSRLSPYVHFGEISPRQVWHAIAARIQAEPVLETGGNAFLRELGWREFYAHALMLHPEMPDFPIKRRFAAFPWRDDEASVRAWRSGRTGYPIVDAGMRQLWHSGWMHNRVRMITASFLIKDLLVPWQTGEAWFWDTLVDADLGNNAGGWQWVAGCGADPAPYFRIFNPVTQGEKFDPCGAYVRRWVPELTKLPDRWIHRPWQASDSELAAAGVRLGRDYPLPIVDHAAARARSLEAFAQVNTTI